MEAERWMIVGLGNPGPTYEGNRHNVGFKVVELICNKRAALSWKPSTRFSAEIAVGELAKRPTVLVKPQTYMNLSGRSVGPLAHFYRVPPERVVVVHDDADLELGRIKVKQGGGDGGHNGLSSVTECMGSADYIRVRAGVGRPRYGDMVDHLLSDFRADELEEVDELVARAARASQTVMTRGLRDAMNRFNRNPKPIPNPNDETSDRSPSGERPDSEGGR